MTIREKLADFISGGALTKAIIRASMYEAEVEEWKLSARKSIEGWRGETANGQRLSEALRKIAEQETSGANATVKRMAKIAREAIDKVRYTGYDLL